MNNSDRLKILMESGRSIFTPLDMRILWGMNALSAKMSAIRMMKNRLLIRLANGYYALNDRYSPYELANRMVSPSYVSFQASLFHSGINFQARREIGSVATRDCQKKVGGVLYTYVAMKKSLFFNREGVVTREGVSIALPERAILDSFYFGYLPDIDVAEKLNKTTLESLSALYPRTVQKRIKNLL